MIWFKFGTIVPKMKQWRENLSSLTASELNAALLTFRIRNTFQYSHNHNHSSGKTVPCCKGVDVF